MVVLGHVRSGDAAVARRARRRAGAPGPYSGGSVSRAEGPDLGAVDGGLVPVPAGPLAVDGRLAPVELVQLGVQPGPLGPDGGCRLACLGGPGPDLGRAVAGVRGADQRVEPRGPLAELVLGGRDGRLAVAHRGLPGGCPVLLLGGEHLARVHQHLAGLREGLVLLLGRGHLTHPVPRSSTDGAARRRRNYRWAAAAVNTPGLARCYSWVT